MPMQIVHLETGRHFYGGGRQVKLLTEGLVKEGVSSTLVCPDDSAIATAVDQNAVQVVTLPMRGDLDLGFARRFGKWLSQSKADLVHVHSRRGADIWGGLAAGRHNMPAVLTRRVDNPEVPVLGKIKYGLFERVIAISQAIREQLLADGVSADRLSVVHSAVDFDSCQPDWTRQQFLQAFDLDAGDKVVVCVAQFIPRKGHADLLAAWQEVSAGMPQAKLVLFGRGPEKEALQALALMLGIDNSVRFAGYREDLRQFLGCADLLVHPAHKEGLGICLLEAQAAGLPVVATRAGGIPEAISAGNTGLLVATSEPGELATAMLRLLSDSGLRTTLAAAAPTFVQQKFAPETMVSGNLAVYEELLRTVHER